MSLESLRIVASQRAVRRLFPVRWPSAVWIVLWACLISSLYLPSLTTRFDFSDDGSLVYPAGPMPLGSRIELYWRKVMTHYHQAGPFRPVAWAHWEVQAEMLGASSFRWRLLRVAWASLAAASMLLLLLEMDIRPAAALAATALAMWAPGRNEIWVSLTLAEGIAMPYALLALVCAMRAARSSRPLGWDLAGAACVLAALGCKNTFAAIVPAQMLLRVAPDGKELRAGWRRHRWRVCALALTLLLPAVHYLLFRLNWHYGQYQPGAPSPGQLGAMLGVLKTAAGLDYLLPGLILTVLALIATVPAVRWRESGPTGPCRIAGAQAAFAALWVRYRAALLSGLLLFVFGIAIYLPLKGVAGRYSIPAVWGADLWFAALLSELGEIGAGAWKRFACGALGLGLAAMAGANLARQEKFAARATMLWRALEFVQSRAPTGACLGWLDGPNLPLGEGVHFYWHLHARGRRDLAMGVIYHGQYVSRPEIEMPCSSPAFLISGPDASPPASASGRWRPLRDFSVPYRLGMRSHSCRVWTRQQE